MTDKRKIKYYAGDYNGALYQSIYPSLYRCTYQRYMSGRVRPQSVVRSGRTADHVRYLLRQRDPHGDIRGDIEIQHLVTLDPVYA